MENLLNNSLVEDIYQTTLCLSEKNLRYWKLFLEPHVLWSGLLQMSEWSPNDSLSTTEHYCQTDGLIYPLFRTFSFVEISFVPSSNVFTLVLLEVEE